MFGEAVAYELEYALADGAAAQAAKALGKSADEDMGQMSAWYIMSALGFYQAEPASGRYWLGSPTVQRAEIAVAGGTFIIETTNNSKENIYIKSIKLNGEDYHLPYIMHSDIARGGKLTVEMNCAPVAP